MAAALAGVVPVVPTIFRDDETVDLGGTARVVDYLMDAGVDGLCLLANYSEQFSLTDAERDAIARTLLERVAGRLPVIVTTSHYSAQVAAARSRAAQDMGAAMVPLPVWKCHSGLPVRASKAMKLPSASPLNTRFPAVDSTPDQLGDAC